MKNTELDITEILKKRKQYSIKLYEYFNDISHTLHEVIEKIKSEGQVIINNEDKIWNSLKEKKNTLLEFDNEIITLSKSSGVIVEERLEEIQKLRKKMEFKILHGEKNYQKFLSLLEEREFFWKEELYILLLKDVEKQPTIISLGQEVDSTFPLLKEYCDNWRKEPIERLLKIINESKKIETFSNEILKEIEELSLLRLDEEYLANLKSIQIPQKCNLLSKELEKFIVNEDYLDILDKIKKNYPYVSDFFEIFKDTSFSSIRTSIRLVNNIHTTEKKLSSISEKFEHIQEILQEVLNKLYSKKEELSKICLDKPTLTQKTCEKWVESNYKEIINLNAQIQQKRNEFVLNSSLIT